MYELKKSELYRLPWSLNDNPIGWLETTDVCNIYCKGCYRQKLGGHKPLEQIKEEILLLKEFRNIDNVSIAGGEPLTHPEIDEIIAFINRQGIKPYLLTNGKAATRSRMAELHKKGMAGVAFHVDMMQKREGWEDKDEIGLIPLREEYLETVKGLGIPISFGITVYRDNYEQVPELVRWGIKNIKWIQGQTFITYRAALIASGIRYHVNGVEVPVDMTSLGYATQEAPDQFNITSNDVAALINKHFPEYGAMCYLGGSTRQDSFKWVIAFMVGSENGWYGHAGPKTMELLQTVHHFFTGTYFAYTRSTKCSRGSFIASLFDPHMRAAAGRYLRNPFNIFKPFYGQSIGIIQAPDVLADGRADMCDSCPDITVYKGKFVYSCRMDEYRKYGGLMQRIPEDGNHISIEPDYPAHQVEAAAAAAPAKRAPRAKKTDDNGGNGKKPGRTAKSAARKPRPSKV